MHAMGSGEFGVEIDSFVHQICNSDDRAFDVARGGFAREAREFHRPVFGENEEVGACCGGIGDPSGDLCGIGSP